MTSGRTINLPKLLKMRDLVTNSINENEFRWLVWKLSNKHKNNMIDE